MLPITNNYSLPISEVEIHQIRAQGAGGQNVNKVSSSVHLRFDIHKSSLPDQFKERLLSRKDQRLNKEGILVIKAQQYRSYEKNRAEALSRLQALIQSVTTVPKQRKASRPSRASQSKRMDKKTLRGKTKALRKKVF
jgi:ribosome-associated protein